MAHDIFISYSSKDKPIADGICASLEREGIRCWIAPRDIAPGEDWPTAITKAISQSKIMVLVFSASSNSSDDVSRELFLAAENKSIIIPFKIEDVAPEPGKQYYLARTHWLDAMNPPTKEQIAILVNRVKPFISSTIPAGTKQDIPAEPPQVLPKPEPPAPPSKKTPRIWPYLVIPLAIILLGAAGWFGYPFFKSKPVAPALRPATKTTVPIKITPALSATPDLLIKDSQYGINLYSGPGENYSIFDVSFKDLYILGQVDGCAWLKVAVSNSQGIYDFGWVETSQIHYPGKCSDIPVIDISFTPTPSFTIPAKLTKLVIQDSLAYNKNGWPIWNTNTDSCSSNSLSFQNGGLVWQIAAKFQSTCHYFAFPKFIRLTDFDVSMDTTYLSGFGKSDAGLAYRIVDGNNQYLFTVNSLNQFYRVQTVIKSKTEDLIGWTYDPVIQEKGTNRLAISARDAQFTFFINDKAVNQLVDVTFPSGYVGLSADVFDSGNITVSNTNFELYTR